VLSGDRPLPEERLVVQSADQAGLATEVLVDGLWGDVGSVSYGRDGGCRESVLQKQFAR